MGQYSVRHPGKRQALKQDHAGPPEGGQKKSLAAEKHGFQTAGPLDVIIDAGGKCHQTALCR